MTEWPLVFLGGLLASSHCVGMCGGFAVAIGLGSRSVAHNVARQLLYSLGRIFTYSFLGAVAGCGGLWLAHWSARLVNLQAVFSIAGGFFLGYLGLVTLGALPRLRWRWLERSEPACLAGALFRGFLSPKRAAGAFLAGLATGFLPCGLVYAYLALASSRASVPLGLATMTVFGAGTVPIMLLTGAGASVLSLAARRQVFRVAAVCVLLTGLVSVARGAVAFRNAPATHPPCPFCRPPMRGKQASTARGAGNPFPTPPLGALGRATQAGKPVPPKRGTAAPKGAGRSVPDSTSHAQLVRAGRASSAGACT